MARSHSDTEPRIGQDSPERRKKPNATTPQFIDIFPHSASLSRKIAGRRQEWGRKAETPGKAPPMGRGAVRGPPGFGRQDSDRR
jgi:hypothetical protein